MDSYKSSSLLSLYLTETPVSAEQNIPSIHIHSENDDNNPNDQKELQDNDLGAHHVQAKEQSQKSQHHNATSPVLAVRSSSSRVSYISIDPASHRAGDLETDVPALGRELSRNSLGPASTNASTISAVNSLYSSVNSFSDEDLDLQSIQSKLGATQLEEKKEKPKFGFLRKKEERNVPLTKDEVFFQQIQDKLISQNYASDKKSTLNVNFLDSCEVFLFGSTLSDLFPSEAELFNYLLQSTYELGEVRFSNLKRYHDVKNQPPIEQTLRRLLPNLARISQVLDLYAESKKNMDRPELFEVFSNYANNIEGGLCLPLAISMFGNWLLTFNKDSTLSSNYENSLILDYFRKGARLSMALLRCRPMLERHSSGFSKNELFELSRYWGKDNLNALSVSLHGLGEYYQYINEYHLATTLWEMNCHLTGDTESGNLAVLGLTDGFGYGNRIKHRNRLGKKSKSNRYDTKRRIAQVYRILMKNPKFDEYGVSWATKTKYD